MRPGSARLAEVLKGSRQVWSTFAVYYDGLSVLDAVPVSAGTWDGNDADDVPGGVSLSVPRYITDARGRPVDLMPTSSGSPLAADGSRLALTYFVAQPGAEPEAIGLGWFRITTWAEGAGTIEVTADALESVIQEARFLNPAQVTPGQTYEAAATALVDRLLPLRVTAAPGNVTGNQTFEEDRLEALAELLAAWPARMYVDASGTLVIAPPYDDGAPAVLRLTDGADGTLVKAPRSGRREGVYNAVKASGEASGDVAPVSAIAYLDSGPYRWNGPFGNVPYFYSSPLLTTNQQCADAARSILSRLQAKAEPITIECAPDPRLELGDIVELAQGSSVRRVRLDTINLPLTYAGTMTLSGHEVGA